MRNYLIFSLAFALLFSCDSKRKYQGAWFDSYYWGDDIPERLEIKNDSIYFKYADFNYWHSYPLNIAEDKFEFNNLSLSAKITTDSLILNNYNIYTKSPYENALQDAFENKIIIELPKLRLNNLKHHDYSNNEYINSHIRYGIRHDNGNYSLQLNDKYAQINDLPSFFSGHHRRHNYFPTNMLFIDKNTPMKYIEEMFLTITLVNQLKISLVNNINIKSNDSIGLYYEYETLNKKLPPFQEKDKYFEIVFDFPIPPPPPPYLFPPAESDISIIKYIFLIENKVYYNNKIIEKTGLNELIKQSVKQNHIIFSLYDLESNYGSFLQMNSMINSAYIELREENSQRKFDKSLNKLNREELTEIKMGTPMKNIWSYSIPHYKTITKENNSFFGLKVNSIDSLISKLKMDSASSAE